MLKCLLLLITCIHNNFIARWLNMIFFSWFVAKILNFTSKWALHSLLIFEIGKFLAFFKAESWIHILISKIHIFVTEWQLIQIKIISSQIGKFHVNMHFFVFGSWKIKLYRRLFSKRPTHIIFCFKPLEKKKKSSLRISL